LLIDCTYELSSSHFTIANSYWARPSLEQLVSAMKAVYRAGRPVDMREAARATRARQDALPMRWDAVAERINGFVEYLDKRPVMRRKLRLGWVSTYNAQCGIAAHSAHLLEFFPKDAFEITIIADDQEPIGPEPDNLVRLWRKDDAGLHRVRDFVVENGFDAVFFQHNFRFYDFGEFADTLLALADADIATFVTLHRTKDLEHQDPRVPHQRTVEALQTCTRVFVHSIDDVNRLREWGVRDNVVLATHGVIDRAPLNADGVRSLLGLAGFGPVIGSFGFLLPGKGLTELIHGFALMLRTFPGAYLLMLNADYPIRESREERERCRALIELLELEDRVCLLGDFRDIEETLLLLGACDAIVYPYQQSEESASGAVRLGLAAGRPVVTTPLPVFAELSEIVCQLSGGGPVEIAEGIVALLQDEDRKAEIVRRQRDWVRANSWAAQAARISNIILGCFEEDRGVELRAPAEAATGSALRRNDVKRAAAASLWSPSEELAAALRLLDRGAASGRTGAPATASGQSADPPSLPQMPPPDGRRFAFFRGIATKSLPAEDGKNLQKKLLSRADRARDSRDWSSAARCYREALDLRPDNPVIWVQYGHALKESGNLPEAERAYRTSLDLDADVADTHLQLGHALKIQGRKIEAEVAYFRALALDPTMEHATRELQALGWTRGRIQLSLRRERSGA
jgi:glycosyltransferase involved in cell wall biosynthesis